MSILMNPCFNFSTFVKRVIANELHIIIAGTMSEDKITYLVLADVTK